MDVSLDILGSVAQLVTTVVVIPLAVWLVRTLHQLDARMTAIESGKVDQRALTDVWRSIADKADRTEVATKADIQRVLDEIARNREQIDKLRDETR